MSDVPPIDFDGSWKDVLDVLLRPFLAFFCADIVVDVDWSEEVVALEQEFRAAAPTSVTGGMRCDKLLRFPLCDGDVAYLHVEVQCQVDDEFPRRAYDYNQGATRFYAATVSTLALLGDDNPLWMPVEFRRERWLCWSGVGFRPIKILGFVGQDAHLERHENPVALVVLAHLKALTTRGDPVERRDWRLRLVRNVCERIADEEVRFCLLAVIERLLPLSPGAEAEVLQEIIRRQEEPKMPYVTSFERHYKAEGLTEGRREGEEKGLREGILAVVRVRFGAPDPAFVTLVSQSRLPELQQAFQAVETASLAELQQKLVASSGQGA